MFINASFTPQKTHCFSFTNIKNVALNKYAMEIQYIFLRSKGALHVLTNVF
jgi:hypothetical protein